MVRNIYDCILIAVLFVLSLVGGAWSACSWNSAYAGCQSGGCGTCSWGQYCVTRSEGQGVGGCYGHEHLCYWDYYYCDTEQELDSLRCVTSGGNWINSECKTCNDHIPVPVPDKCVEVWKNGYTTDSDGNPGGGGYWAIETYECYYDLM